MSIHFISGKPGGGKSLYGVRLIVDELIKGNRTVVTNVPLLLGRLNEYLEQKNEKGVRAAFARWRLEHGGSDLGSITPESFLELCNMHISNRVLLLTEDDLPKFFTYRGAGVRLKSVTNAEWKAGKRPDYSLVKDAGVFYVLDEVHIAFNSRAWADTGAEVLYYLSQHRKLGDDVVCITQSVGNVDKQFRSVAQDFTYIKNLSKQNIGHFRLPLVFTTNTFPTVPTETSKPMESGTFKLDVSGLASCYDTARGVGIHGRAADTGARKKGFHWAWAVVIVAGLMFFAFEILPGLLARFTDPKHAKVKPVATAVVAPVPPPAREVPAVAPVAQPAPATASPQTNVVIVPASTNELFCKGYTIFGHDVTLYLSDGSTVDSLSGRIQEIARGYVVVDQVKLPVRTAAVSTPVPATRAGAPVVSYTPEPPLVVNHSASDLVTMELLAEMARQSAPAPLAPASAIQVAPTIHGAGHDVAQSQISGIH